MFFLICLLVLKNSFVCCDYGKIIGGEPALEREFPYVVSIQEKFSRLPLCGGVILDASHALTACHCCGEFTGTTFEYFEKENLLVMSGSINRLKGKLSNVETITRHEKCSEMIFGWTYDYGLYTLKERLRFTPFIQPIKLLTRDIKKLREIIMDEEKLNCWSVGWGHQTMTAPGEYSNASFVLKKINVLFVPWDACEDSLCSPPKYRCVNDLKERKQICVKGIQGDTCTGDSGGPLVCNGTVYALISWGPACGEYPYPTVYGAISEALFWPEIHAKRPYSNNEKLFPNLFTIFVLINIVFIK